MTKTNDDFAADIEYYIEQSADRAEAGADEPFTESDLKGQTGHSPGTNAVAS